MTSQRSERTWIRTGGYGRFRGEWVKEADNKINGVTYCKQGLYSFVLFKFDDFFHEFFKFATTLGLAVTKTTFKNVLA